MKRPLAPFVLAAIASIATCPAITINGLTDETTYTGSVTFDVVHDEGFGFQVLINGNGYGTGEPITITEPNFHELIVNKFAPGSNEIVESETVRFVVRSPERGSSETGLPAWVPRRNIPASNAEINSGTFQLIAPSRFPLNWPVPVIAKILDGDGKALRIMADADLNSGSIRLYRGVSSKHLPAVGLAGSLNVTITAASQALTKDVIIAALPTTTAPSTIDADTAWHGPGIVRVEVDLTVEAGATLTIGPEVIVQIGDGVDLTINGGLQIDGDSAHPVVFTSGPDAVWGGCIVNGELNASFLIITRGGEDSDWFSGSGYSAHRKEQATFLFDTDSTGSFEDCYWIENPGQALHVRNATLSLDRCLVQRGPTTGQFNGGAVTLRDCHLIEFPIDSPEFNDDDNDAIYFTSGDHELHDTVIGWAKDDGVDAGSGSTGTVLVDGCWFESCFHEAMAWSGGGREVTVRNTVALNSGQGIECGWSDSANSPIVNVSDSICIGNFVGLRFGDNYDWDYNGFLTVGNSLSIYNGRDVWGYEWDSWTYRTDAMDIQNNWLTEENPHHPNNSVWDGGNLALLQALEPTTRTTGVGYSSAVLQRPMSDYGQPIEFAASSFGAIAPGLGFTISEKVVGKAELTNLFGGLRMSSGQMLAEYSPVYHPGGQVEYIRLTIHDGSGGEITTPRHLVYIDTPGVDNVEEFVPLGSTWAYLDDGSDPGPGWTEENFDDSAWKYGPAELGYGDDDEATEINDSAAGYPTYYFRHQFEPDDLGDDLETTLRLRRDDGAIVYLNGIEVMRSNMPDGEVSHSDFAASTVDDEDEYVTMNIDTSLLIDDDNIIAVEVHQANATSSDVSFDLGLTAVRPLPTRLFLSSLGGSKALLIWTGSSSSVLQRSPDLINWTDLPDATSPMEIDFESPSGRQFYRLAD